MKVPNVHLDILMGRDEAVECADFMMRRKLMYRTFWNSRLLFFSIGYDATARSARGYGKEAANVESYNPTAKRVHGDHSCVSCIRDLATV